MDYAPTASTTPTRHRERVGYDRDDVHAVLDEALLCHVGFVVDGAPVVLPQLHARVGDELFLHGSTGARGLRMARDDGLDVCVTATLVEGLVLARSAFHHSINFRSVVVHGRAFPVTEEAQKQSALQALVEAVATGRSAEVRGPSRRELAATTVLRLSLGQSSVKTRTGPPVDEPEDHDLPYWAGVLPVRMLVPGAPEPAPELAEGIAVPEHVTGWTR